MGLTKIYAQRVRVVNGNCVPKHAFVFGADNPSVPRWNPIDKLESFLHEKHKSLSSLEQTSSTFQAKVVKAMIERFDSLRWEERFLASLVNTKSIHLYVPERDDQEQVLKILRALADERKILHLRGFGINSVLLPITLAMGILPGPNVFFLWNLFRWYSHGAALTGSVHLKRSLVASMNVDVLSDLETLSQKDDLAPHFKRLVQAQQQEQKT